MDCCLLAGFQTFMKYLGTAQESRWADVFIDYGDPWGNLFCTPHPKLSTLYPLMTQMKGDLREPNTPYTTYLHLRQQGNKRGERNREQMGH